MSAEVPDALYEAPDLAAVVAYLIGQAAPGKDKVRALRRWSDWTETSVPGAIYAEVDRSGIDRAPEIGLPGEG